MIDSSVHMQRKRDFVSPVVCVQFRARKLQKLCAQTLVAIVWQYTKVFEKHPVTVWIMPCCDNSSDFLVSLRHDNVIVALETDPASKTHINDIENLRCELWRQEMARDKVRR